MGDVEFLEAKVAGLERDNRLLQAALWDRFAAAALTGLLAYYGDRSHIVDEAGRTSLHFAAADHAEQLLRVRGERGVS